ncbi:MAG: ParB N-terminal domain-containing protein [Planctomycetes bacterium]|nr:ParB N-terminal domain-containing protein [Planctomycetota bacterium]MBL7143206.1 ParB-like nuclease domain-containing protein [Phycisphaerae bacterium]
MLNQVQSIALDKLVAHPDNPNRMSKAKFAKLVRNIERTVRYEPLVVRPCPRKPDCFQIINGHHRWRALRELGYKTAEALVWDVNDQDTDILLATLNRLGGSDVLDKKLALLKRLNKSAFDGRTAKLAKLLPQTSNQIKRLTELAISDCLKAVEKSKTQILNPLVFFLNDKQQEVIAKALSDAMSQQKPALSEAEWVKENRTRAVKNAAALTYIAQEFINSQQVSL